MPGTPESPDSLVGEECHIVAKKAGEARFRPLSIREQDDYKNLILLCRNHHKLVDDQWETFTEPMLRVLKANHERWATATLATAASQETAPTDARRVGVRLLRTGQDVISVAVGAHADDFKHDRLEDEDEVGLVGGFLQVVSDSCEMWDEMEPADRVRADFYLDQELKRLRGRGFLVYGAQTAQRIDLGKGGVFDDWRVASLRVLRVSNPRVPPEHRDSQIGSE